ncbi:MAG: transcriptional regulator AsnC [Halobacteriovorax sp.]|nr:transcriptional regulator AsnC [Halobacteriovorax sp.]|tara:strand:- start:85291 stop:85776 length:486 start_codon:yes stop_codon:yes gene_type:complete
MPEVVKIDDYELDDVDREILKRLIEDSRTSFQEIARDLIVSGGTIHVRVNKMKEAGIITGSKLKVDFSRLGLEVGAFVGINLRSAGDYKTVLDKLDALPEIVEVHYTTGNYSMFVKVLAKNTKELHLFLIERLQAIPEIQSTETLISLDNPISRDPEIPRA